MKVLWGGANEDTLKASYYIVDFRNKPNSDTANLFANVMLWTQISGFTTFDSHTFIYGYRPTFMFLMESNMELIYPSVVEFVFKFVPVEMLDPEDPEGKTVFKMNNIYDVILPLFNGDIEAAEPYLKYIKEVDKETWDEYIKEKGYLNMDKILG